MWEVKNPKKVDSGANVLSFWGWVLNMNFLDCSIISCRGVAYIYILNTFVLMVSSTPRMNQTSNPTNALHTLQTPDTNADLVPGGPHIHVLFNIYI